MNSQVRERRLDWVSSLFVGLIFLVYFVFPKSLTMVVDGRFDEFGLYLGPWYFQRYLLMFICALYFFVKFLGGKVLLTRDVLIFILFMLAFGLISGVGGEFVFVYAYCGFSAYFLMTNIKYARPSPLLVKFVIFCVLVYSCQYFIYRVGDRFTGGFLDPNISGYYLFLCYAILRSLNKKTLFFIVVFVGIMSFSRNFLLAVFLFEILRSRTFEYIFMRLPVLKSPVFLISISLLFVTVFTSFMLNSNNVNETIGGGVERLSNLRDESNYHRAEANYDMFERMLDGEFVFLGNGSEKDADTATRPHNSFLRAIYRYGLLVSLLSFFVFSMVLSFSMKYSPELSISVFAYYTLLNDFITGPDLILFLCVAYLCKYLKEYGQTNSMKKYRFKVAK
jgi:hypothetical protein